MREWSELGAGVSDILCGRVEAVTRIDMGNAVGCIRTWWVRVPLWWLMDKEYEWVSRTWNEAEQFGSSQNGELTPLSHFVENGPVEYGV